MSKKIFTVVSLLLAFVFLVSVAQPAYTSNEGKMRVWVEFSPGRGARVEKSLNTLGAEFHYRFRGSQQLCGYRPGASTGWFEKQSQCGLD